MCDERLAERPECAVGSDGRTLHYLTGGPIYIDGKRVTGKGKTAMGEAKGIEDLHVITYDTRTGAYRDNGLRPGRGKEAAPS